jgi:23S rRNA pseudouridine1911/1915/1917 synthase
MHEGQSLKGRFTSLALDKHKSMPETFEFVVPEKSAGERLDIFLVRQMPDWSRSQISRLIREGLVSMGPDRAQKSGDLVETGQKITVIAQLEEPHVAPEDLPLEILYEDSDLLVVNKEAGMVVHVGAGAKSGTLVNALLGHAAKLSTEGGDERPGIVHRLDKMTSGLILIAKNNLAHRRLSEMFKGREVHKTYLALVHGRITAENGQINRPIGRDPHHRTRMRADGIAAREALTKFHVLRRLGQFTLVEAMPFTGRTHQIRVHLASLGHPVVGDTTYGAPAKLRFGKLEEPTLPRTFLHAAKLALAHPITGASLNFEAPMPDELVKFLAHLETHRG